MTSSELGTTPSRTRRGRGIGSGKFLLRHERVWTGKTNWTKGHMEWIRQQKFEHEAQNQVLREYIRKLDEAAEAVDRFATAIAEAVKGWVLEPLVKNYQALRGVRLLTATVIAAEVGDMRRFATAKHFMSFVGLVPSENSSGDVDTSWPDHSNGEQAPAACARRGGVELPDAAQG